MAYSSSGSLPCLLNSERGVTVVQGLTQLMVEQTCDLPFFGFGKVLAFSQKYFSFLASIQVQDSRLCSSLETNENENENEVLRREEAFSATHLFRVSRGKCTSYE